MEGYGVPEIFIESKSKYISRCSAP